MQSPAGKLGPWVRTKDTPAMLITEYIKWVLFHGVHG